MTTEAKRTEKMYNFTIICKENNPAGELARVEHVPSRFRCPVCGTFIAYLADERKIGIHGRMEKTLKHELRQATEL